MTTGRQVPFCLFTDLELARVELSEREARERGVAYRLAKIPMDQVLRTRTLSETRGFLKAVIEKGSDRILGFTALGVEAGELLPAVQLAMAAGSAVHAAAGHASWHTNDGRGARRPCSSSVSWDDR